MNLKSSFPRCPVAKKFLGLGAFCSLCLASTTAYAEENASNPLAAVNSTDLRYQYFDLGGADKQDAFIDGSFMLRPNLKFKYELHYNSTDVTGGREKGLEKVNAKLIYFPSARAINETWVVKTAVGLEWIIDLGDTSKGIGTESDQFAPLVGAAFSNTSTGLTLLPLIQHFESYNGPTDVSQTALRLIAIQPFAEDWWVKGDLKLPFDWENDTWPASAEVQVGYNVNDGIAVYADILVGVGSDRTYDQGIGFGLRVNY